MKSLAKFFGFVAIAFWTVAIYSCANDSADGAFAFIPAASDAYIILDLSDVSKTVLPDTQNAALSDFVLKGAKSGEAQTTLGSWATKESMQSASIPVATGTWTFTLSASCGGTSFSGTIEKNIVSGENRLSFALDVVDQGNGSGSFSVSVSFATAQNASKISRVTAVLENLGGTLVDGVTEQTLTPKNGAVTFASSGIAVGTYRIRIRFFAEEFEVGSYRELVQISSGLCSRAERTIESFDDLFTITYVLNGGNFKAGITVPETFSRKSVVVLPTDIVRDNYNFSGWYTDEDCSDGKEISVIENYDKNITVYAKYSAVTLSETPLTLEAVSATATVTFVNKASGAVTYKVNGGAAQTIASGETKEISLAKAGDKVAFYGDNSAYASHPNPSDDWSLESYTRSYIDCSADCYVYGNIMSLIKSSEFADVNLASGAEYVFVGLFANNTHIKNKDGADLLLPSAIATTECYKSMFKGCAALTKAPVLPATVLEKACYSGMFEDCTSIASAPALPATTLAAYCYGEMFKGCSNLAKAPESIPAEKIEECSCINMFRDCKKLIAAPDLPATTLAKGSYWCMFFNCENLTTVPSVLPAAVMAESCYECMFASCTNLAVAPKLPATTLAKQCYYCMFTKTNLAAAPELPAETLAEGCYKWMFSDCQNLSSVTCLATDISATGCTEGWLAGVKTTGTFTKAKGMTSWKNGIDGIPYGWTPVDKLEQVQEGLNIPLTLEAISSAATVTFVNKASGAVTYKVNGGSAQTIASGETKAIAFAKTGDKVAFYGNNSSYASHPNSSDDWSLEGYARSYIDCSADCYIYGNIMSLIKSSEFAGANFVCGSERVFLGFFANNTHIKNKDGAEYCFCRFLIWQTNAINICSKDVPALQKLRLCLRPRWPQVAIATCLKVAQA